MSYLTVIIRAEEEPLPPGSRVVKLLAAEDRAFGTGTNTRRWFTLLVERLDSDAARQETGER